MKLIEKMAKEWINKPKYVSVLEGVYLSRDPDHQSRVDFERTWKRAYEAGFEAAQELILSLKDTEGHSYHSTWMADKIKYLGDEEV